MTGQNYYEPRYHEPAYHRPRYGEPDEAEDRSGITTAEPIDSSAGDPWPDWQPARLASIESARPVPSLERPEADLVSTASQAHAPSERAKNPFEPPPETTLPAPGRRLPLVWLICLLMLAAPIVIVWPDGRGRVSPDRESAQSSNPAASGSSSSTATTDPAPAGSADQEDVVADQAAAQYRTALRVLDTHPAISPVTRVYLNLTERYTHVEAGGAGYLVTAGDPERQPWAVSTSTSFQPGNITAHDLRVAVQRTAAAMGRGYQLTGIVDLLSYRPGEVTIVVTAARVSVLPATGGASGGGRRCLFDELSGYYTVGSDTFSVLFTGERDRLTCN